MKVVINDCYGGFGLSKEAYEMLGLEWDGYGYADISRTDTRLVECVEKLAEKANGAHANLKVIDIPDDIKWNIETHDGREHIAEVHRKWY